MDNWPHMHSATLLGNGPDANNTLRLLTAGSGQVGGLLSPDPRPKGSQPGRGGRYLLNSGGPLTRSAGGLGGGEQVANCSWPLGAARCLAGLPSGLRPGRLGRQGPRGLATCWTGSA